MCTGTVAVQVSPASQVVSDATAEVEAFNAHYGGTEERVLSWRTET